MSKENSDSDSNSSTKAFMDVYKFFLLIMIIAFVALLFKPNRTGSGKNIDKNIDKIEKSIDDYIDESNNKKLLNCIRYKMSDGRILIFNTNEVTEFWRGDSIEIFESNIYLNETSYRIGNIFYENKKIDISFNDSKVLKMIIDERKSKLNELLIEDMLKNCH